MATQAAPGSEANVTMLTERPQDPEGQGSSPSLAPDVDTAVGGLRF